MIIIYIKDKNKLAVFLIYIGISLILMGIMILSGFKLEQKNKNLTDENIQIQAEVEGLKESNQRLEYVILELQDKVEVLEQEKNELEEAKVKREKLVKAEKKKKDIQAAKANRGGGNRTNIFIATAYDLTVASCGKLMDHPQYGITASGYSLKGKSLSDKFIAVDPKVIELGSVVHIEFFEPYVHLTGNYTAVDTGGAIKGSKVDIFFGGQNVSKEVSNFGRRKVRVTY